MIREFRRPARITSALVLALAVPAVASAQEHAPKPPPLISHEDLQKRLSDPKLRVLDARSRADYDRSHVPGAVWVDGKAFQEASKPETIADASAWSQALAPLGLDADAEVFVIGGPRQDAARVWWLLGYAGVKQVGLVDGGFALWEKQGRPVASEVPAISPRSLPVQLHPRRIASRADVQAAIARGDSQVLDIRSAAEYRGEKVQHPGTRPGHIPTARSLDAHELIDVDGKFVDATLISKRLASAGIDRGKPVIVYSNTGARASLAVFALRRLGVPARSYYQGLADWSSDASAPLILGDKPGSLPQAK